MEKALVINKKEAGNYSSKLKILAETVKESLVGYNAEGIYEETTKIDKSELRTITGKSYEDEEEVSKPKTLLGNVSPVTRVQMLIDLLDEINKIDYEIETRKNEAKIMSPFLNKEVTFDFAKKENIAYGDSGKSRYGGLGINLLSVIGELKKLNDKVPTQNSEKIITTINADNGRVDLKAKVSVDKKLTFKKDELNKLYEEYSEKARLQSKAIEKCAIQDFEFTPKFSLNETIDSLIARYNTTTEEVTEE